MFTPKFKIAAKIVVARLRAVSFEIWYPIPKKLHNALKEAPKYRNPVYFHASLNASDTNNSITIRVAGIAHKHSENNRT